MSSLLSPRQHASSSASSLLTCLGAAVLAISIVLLVAACDKHELVGKWQSKSTGEIVEFTSDGRMIDTKGVTSGPEIIYKIEGNVIAFDFGGVWLRAEYRIDGDTLTLQDPVSGGTNTLTRVD